MPSTYTLNNGIELIATGEQSGTWGDTTNTNLSLLDTALDGQVTVTLPSAGTSGSPNTLAIADGSASDGRNRMVIFNDGGDLGATAYVQLTPNDAEKIIYIRNDLAGSRSIILFQGTYSASNDYEVPAGTTAVVYFDGAGSGAVAANVFNNAYFDSLRLGSVSVDKILDEDNMASDDASALATQQSIKAYVDSQVTAQDLDFGGDSGTGAVDLDSQTFTIAGTANEIETSASGQTLTVGLPDNVTITGDLTVDTDTLYVDSANNKVGIGTTSPAKQLHIESSTGGTLRLSSSDTSVGVGESLGQIDWYSNDASGSGSGVRAFVNVVENDGGLGRAYDMTFGTGQVATATERMRIDSSGNVGIGGTPTVLGGQNYVSVHSPGSSTNIAGYDLYVSGTREASLISYPNNSEALRIAGLTNRPVTFHANNAERMRIDSNGNVGIGTSAPVNNTNRATLGLQGAWGGQLDIMVGSTVHAQFGSDNFNTGLSARIQSQDGIVFRTNGNNERMRITSAGDVSISGDLTGLRYFDVYNTASTSTDGAVIRLITEQVGSTSTTSADIIKRKNGEFRISNFETNAAAYMAFNVGSSERMKIDSSGNVGIGTSSPSQKLTISGGTSDVAMLWNSTDTAYYNFGILKNGSLVQMGEYNNAGDTLAEPILNIEMNGNNVGIGTTTATTKIDINAFPASGSGASNTNTIGAALAALHGNTPDNNQSLALRTTGSQLSGITGSFYVSQVYAPDNNNALEVFTGGSTPLVFGTSATERMRIDSSGNVGIGTSSVTSTYNRTLQISTTGNNSAIRLTSGASTSGFDFVVDGTTAFIYNRNNTPMVFATNAIERMRIDSSGNLGLGTTTPQSFTNQKSLTINGTTTGRLDLQGGGVQGGTIFSTSGTNLTVQSAYGNMLTLESGTTGAIQFKTNGAEKMRMTQYGYLGLGDSSPAYKFHSAVDSASSNYLGDTTVYAAGITNEDTTATNAVAMAFGHGGYNYTHFIASIRKSSGADPWGDLSIGGRPSDSGGFVDRIYLKGDTGNVGIGTTAPSSRLDVFGSVDGTVATFGNAQDNAYLMLQAAVNYGSDNSLDNKWSLRWRGRPNAGGHSLAFYDEENATERMRIDSGGNMLVGMSSTSGLGTTNSGNYFAANGNSNIVAVLGTGNNKVFQWYNANGEVGSISTNGSSTSYNTSSDYRLKENVVELTGATDRLKQLEPKRFNFIADADTTVDGFLAHEVQTVVPEAITGTHNEVDADGNSIYQGIDQSKLVPLLVATIKELEARITALENA